MVGAPAKQLHSGCIEAAGIYVVQHCNFFHHLQDHLFSNLSEPRQIHPVHEQISFQMT
jgi:hypothetical protein